MCDTIVAPPVSTAERVMLFGKNSDRQRNEAQAVEFHPAAEHAAGAALSCTYIAIPQAARTHAVLVCRPFWIWGAEMGANEHGVVIGNEGLYARVPAPEAPGLLGMDLLRLGLERAASAAEAVKVMTLLLERYGQGGNCGHLAPAYYHNSFLIADPTEAFVLETVGREWLVQRAHRGRAISNRYSIAQAADRTSSGLMALLREYGLGDEAASNYAEAIADPHRTHVGSGRERFARSTALLNQGEGRLQLADMMRILRDHHCPGQPENWDPAITPKAGICAHAGPDEHAGQTTGSLVSQIRPHQAVHWVTATSAPCISIFKPVLLDVPLPAHGPAVTDRFDPQTLWWRHEKLYRTALAGDFPQFVAAIEQERDALEASFRARINTVLEGGSPAERAQVIASCWREAGELQARWHARITSRAAAQDSPFASTWTRFSQLAGLQVA